MKLSLKESERLRHQAEKERTLATLLAIDILEGKGKKFGAGRTTLILSRPTGAAGGLCIVRTVYKADGSQTKQINHEFYYFEDFYRSTQDTGSFQDGDFLNRRKLAELARIYIRAEHAGVH